ncbi:MAG: sigma-54-dependent Fis family transcriptional regulator [Nitrospiraceae bacterium]|nr:MAG: sigma-54-dependent Fis family transcriptional regulator [Nitrospiraceae bacterium]
MDLKILIAEDEEITLKHLRYSLLKDGYALTCVTNGLDAFNLIEKEPFDILIADIKMPKMDGLTLLQKVKERFPGTEVIIITGFGSIESAVNAMKQGASDYITKPFNLDELNLKIKKIQEKKNLEKENLALKASLDPPFPLSGKGGPWGKLHFIAKSKPMQRVIEVINSIANSDCNVLITGESGVGKGLVAKLIHHTGLRKDKPFLAINCAIFTEELLASELFGHEKGAFTGAIATKQGLIEIANNGTIFLDEIAEMPPNLQAKLLKVIEDKEFLKVGGTRPVRVNVRFMAATNQNILELVSTGRFREDLYYRLNVMDIYIPPLRERKTDIIPLATYFLEKHAQKENKKFKGITKETLDVLSSYGFPGNVRELENIIERAVILEKNESITPESLPQTIKLFQIETIDPNRIKTIDEINKEYAEKVLDFAEDNKSRAAELLGISRTSLWRILKK